MTQTWPRPADGMPLSRAGSLIASDPHFWATSGRSRFFGGFDAGLAFVSERRVRRQSRKIPHFWAKSGRMGTRFSAGSVFGHRPPMSEPLRTVIPKGSVTKPIEEV